MGRMARLANCLKGFVKYILAFSDSIERGVELDDRGLDITPERVWQRMVAGEMMIDAVQCYKAAIMAVHPDHGESLWVYGRGFVDEKMAMQAALDALPPDEPTAKSVATRLREMADEIEKGS